MQQRCTTEEMTVISGFTRLLAAVIIVGGVCSAGAAQPFGPAQPTVDKKHMAYLQVQRMTTKTGGQFSWWTDYGSYNRNYKRSVGIQITVRNMSRFEDELKIEWYFVAKQLSNSKLSIFDRGAQTVKLKAGENVMAAAASKPIEAKDNTYVMLGVREVSGSKLEGYAVLVKAGDEVIASNYSMQHLEKVLPTLLGDPAK